MTTDDTPTAEHDLLLISGGVSKGRINEKVLCYRVFVLGQTVLFLTTIQHDFVHLLQVVHDGDRTAHIGQRRNIRL